MVAEDDYSVLCSSFSHGETLMVTSSLLNNLVGAWRKTEPKYSHIRNMDIRTCINTVQCLSEIKYKSKCLLLGLGI